MTKNNVLRVLVALVIGTVALQLSTTKSFAEKECIKEYGGGETCIENNQGNLEVNKKIKNPDTGDFEDHINPTDGSHPYIFGTSEVITFSIEVKNTGDIKIKDIKLEDILPSFVKYRNGDGDGDDNNTKVKFDEFDLEPGEKKEFEFTAKVNSSLPKGDRICLSNIAQAKGKLEDSNDKIDDADYANFCVQENKSKGKEHPKTLPVTGGNEEENHKELANLILLGSVSAGLVLIGFGLKKIAK